MDNEEHMRKYGVELNPFGTYKASEQEIATSTKRLTKEIQGIKDDPPTNFTAGPIDESNPHKW